MPRPNYPDPIVLNQSIREFPKGYFREPLAYLNVDKWPSAEDHLREWLQSTLTASAAIRGQKNKTTPRTVSNRLNDLIRSLKPFIEKTQGIDQDTFDLLSEDAAALYKKAKGRVGSIAAIRLNAGNDVEIRNHAASLADKIFSKLAFDNSISNRRKFVCLMLDLANLKYPDPDSSPAKFDAILNTPL